AASLVPVSCMVRAADFPLTSLRQLRRGLAESGVPGYDLFLRGGGYDLSRERDLLALSEPGVLDHLGRRRAAGPVWLEIGGGAHVDRSARLLGPVVVQDGAQIAAGAVVVGPAVVGRRASIQREATVAQCVVGAGARVAAGLTVRHRALFG